MDSDWLEQLTHLITHRCSDLLGSQVLGEELIVAHLEPDLIALLRNVIASEIVAARKALNGGEDAESPDTIRFREFYNDDPDWTRAADSFLGCFKETAFRAALKERLLAGTEGIRAWLEEQPSWTARFKGVIYVASQIKLFDRMAEWVEALTSRLITNTYEFGVPDDLQAEFESGEASAAALADRILADWLTTLAQDSSTWKIEPALAAEYGRLFEGMKAELNG